MSRTPSRLNRLVRAGTAVVTVWCLGCCGYEPVLENLLGAETGSIMECAGDDGVAGSTDIPSARTAASAVAAVSAASQPAGSSACACICQNCHAPSPSLAIVAPAPSSAPRAAVTEVTSLPSVVRAPLVPPPQVQLLRA